MDHKTIIQLAYLLLSSSARVLSPTPAKLLLKTLGVHLEIQSLHALPETVVYLMHSLLVLADALLEHDLVTNVTF